MAQMFPDLSVADDGLPALQGAMTLGDGLICFYGADQHQGDRIARRKGLTVPWPWATVSLFDDEGAHLGILLHGYTGPGGSLSISFDDNGLRFSVPLVAFLYHLVFVNRAAGEVFTRVGIAEPRRRTILRRLGFVHHALEHRVGLPSLIVMRATPETLPAWFRRWRARHVH